MHTLCWLAFMTGAHAVFDPRHFLLCTFTAVDEGFVGIILNNGAVTGTVLDPGMNYRGLQAYFGESTFYHNTMVDYEPYPRSVHFDARSIDGTNWMFKLLGANQVTKEDAVAVIRANGDRYDRNISCQFNSAVKEVVAQLTDLEIRKTRANDLNEMFRDKVQHEINLHVPEGPKIKIIQVTIELKECGDNRLLENWEQGVLSEAALILEKKQRAVTAEKQISMIKEQEAEAQYKKIIQDAANERIIAEAVSAAESKRLEATSSANISAVHDVQSIASARAKAEAIEIVANAELLVETNRARMLEKFSKAAQHERSIAATAAYFNNAKHHDTVVSPENLGSTFMGRLFKMME